MTGNKFNRSEFCCDEMFLHISEREVAIRYSRVFREFGIKILDGGSSIQMIDFCPWCGKKLPTSLRDECANELEKLGYELFDDNIPQKYKTDKWWRDKNL
jgi:hypothetical protein